MSFWDFVKEAWPFLLCIVAAASILGWAMYESQRTRRDLRVECAALVISEPDAARRVRLYAICEAL